MVVRQVIEDTIGPANFGHEEDRDGYSTQGSYYVDLPDGRRQIVTYHVADGYSGYIADVMYEKGASYSGGLNW